MPVSPVSCLVLDDDLLARELAVGFVEQVPGLVLAGAYEQPLAAYEHLSRVPVDLLITDVEMPGLNGLELVQALRQPPLVVFMTSHRQYAPQSYDLDAVDYLLKPLSFERFLRAANKAQMLLQMRDQWERTGAAPALATEAEYCFIRTELQFLKLRYADIAFVEAMRDFTKVHLLDGTVHITLVNLKHIDEQLPAALFIRTHRSFLANIDHIEAISSYEVRLGNGKIIPLGQTFRDTLTERVVQQRLVRRK